MTRYLPITLVPVLSFLLIAPATWGQEASQQNQQAEIPDALDFTVESIDGEEVELKKYLGDVVLVVNVASRCGMTLQYEALQKLHEQYGGDGLSILGFPCNQFGNQEPGTEEEILEFCKSNFGVQFDMFSKVNVNGEDQAEFFEYLTSQETEPLGKGDVRWNFEKFLISRDGKVVARFGSRTKPDSEEMVEAIEKELGTGK